MLLPSQADMQDKDTVSNDLEIHLRTRGGTLGWGECSELI